ncbi:hypothetical protein Tco_0708191, partial [Tanacetum coccineum]
MFGFGSQDDIPPPPPPPPSSQTPTQQQTPHTVSTIKLPILKKGEYDIWAMKMEHYLAHTDYPIWEVIQNGNGPVSSTTDTQGQIKVLPPRTAKEILARERERKARTTLLMSLPEDHLAKFHKMTDAKEMWEAIKSRFGGNDESKKMQKYILKQQFEGFSVSNSEGLHKGYDRFQSLLSQLEIHRAGSTASSFSTQNVAFVSENTSSTNNVSTAYGVSNSSDLNSSYEQTSSYSLIANQSSCPQLYHEDLEQIDEFDLEQIDEFDLEEIDLKWQVAMISMRMKKFYKKTGRELQFDAKEPVGFDKTKVEYLISTRPGILLGNAEIKELKMAREEILGTLEIKIGEELLKSNTEVNSCTNECKESYAKLKKLYDEQRKQLSDASIEIQAYTQGLKKVEAQLVAHQQGQLCLLQKNQMSAYDKFGLGYGDHRYDGILSYENEVLQSVFKSKESEFEKQPLYDRFVTAGGMKAVPPPMTGNYMPSRPDIEIDYSQFTYGPKQSPPSESETQTTEFDTCESDISIETPELVSEPVVIEPNVVSQPKVWSDAPIIEEYESDSDDDCVSIPTIEHDQPSFANTNKQVKTPRETVKNQLSKKSRQSEIRPIWNNVQKVNKQNQFVPIAVLIRDGKIPFNTANVSGTKNVSTARHNFNRQTVLSNTRKVNTVKPMGSTFSKSLNRTTSLRSKFSNQKVNTAGLNAVSAVGGKRETAVKPSAGCNWRSKGHIWNKDNPQRALKNKGIVDSGCSRHMTGNKAYLAEYQDFNGGPVVFGGCKGYITGKGKIKTRRLDFEDVCFVKELQHFNLFSVSQMCDKKNKVLFTDTECLVLSPEFKLPEENQITLKIPRQNNMYSFNLENIAPSG